ncbi:somatostatin receptor type 4-like [Dendronephthya gigantea]|uniref:somatostatin receptor type 4-like n=1 Tax=Dendronephthya gigantea TaxID=151771 RepID=UPI0010699A96|nr:somatostatin receptor type 4-like [Dendronephthya gigantea]XP_028410138.1 somatostatin receptor type 4-like [Dendronephthya gigantea]XP_028410146.1 somatostatin receptor type 4-like [Dendronephthya gigantea]XP_028410155.1 somatostatin receptor type 4-like [Dendronephthya gigantea]
MAFAGNTWWTYLIFSLIATFALLGNSLVLFVLLTKKSYLKQPYNIFIFSLALTDILSGIFLVISRYLYLPPTPEGEIHREVFCRTIWSAWVLFTLGYISIYTCTALTFERWLAVTKPQTYRAVRPGQAIKAVVFVWLWGIIINITTLFRAKFIPEKQSCSWTSLSVANEVFPWIDFTLQSIVPFVSMVLLYLHILHTMKRLPVMSAEHNPIKKVTKVALAASTTIIIGWIPSRVSFMLSKYGIVDPNSLLHYCLIMLSIANSCWNPALYGIYSSQFRTEYAKLYRRLFCLEKHHVPVVEGVVNNGARERSSGSTGTQSTTKNTQL